jgi:hypothetical protein
LLAGVSSPAVAATYSQAFVSAFAEACVPGRLSYPGTQQAAVAAGWQEVESDHHPELAAMLAVAAKALEDPELDVTYEDTFYARDIEGMQHHLVVARSSFVIGEPDDPLNPWVYIGCYLYNFDAGQPIDPSPVITLIGKPIAQTVEQDGLIGYVWGPPCPMPRTGDTYMSFIADGSPVAMQTGFSGLMLKFETSEPDPGEEVPETYC